MVIQCTQCNTRFKIADEKIKPGGIKVRCSKCRNIFRVTPPEPEIPLPAREGEIDFDAFNMKPVAEEATASGVPESAPGKTEGEEPEGLSLSSESSRVPGELEEDTASRKSAEFDFEEESAPQQGPAEFDFEEEPSSQGPAEFDFGEEPVSHKDPAEFDFGEESPTQGPEEFDFGEEPPAHEGPEEFDFEEEPLSQGPAEFDFEEESALEPGPMEFGFEEEEADGSEDFSFETTEPFSDEVGETEKGAGAPEDFVFESTDESAEIDDFDLSRMTFGDEEEPAAPGGDVGSIPMEQTPEIDEGTAVQAPSKESRESAGKAEKAAAPAAAPRRKSPFKGLLVFVLVLLLALCGVAGYFFWERGDLDIVKIVEQLTGKGSPKAVAGQIRLNELSSSFITNREAGQLFVIQGKATNDYSEARSAIAVKGILYNKTGQPLLQQTVFCGNHLDPDVLRTLPFAKIEEGMNNQFGDSLSNLNVGPGKSIPFTIVFKNLPPDLAEYTVETVDSKPGSKP